MKSEGNDAEQRETTMQIAEKTTESTEAPKQKRPRKTFAQQLAEIKAKQEKVQAGIAKKLAKADKEGNPQLAAAATALDSLKRAQKILKKFSEGIGQSLSLDDAVSMLSQELAAAAPDLLAKLEAGG